MYSEVKREWELYASLMYPLFSKVTDTPVHVSPRHCSPAKYLEANTTSFLQLWYRKLLLRQVLVKIEKKAIAQEWVFPHLNNPASLRMPVLGSFSTILITTYFNFKDKSLLCYCIRRHRSTLTSTSCCDFTIRLSWAIYTYCHALSLTLDCTYRLNYLPNSQNKGQPTRAHKFSNKHRRDQLLCSRCPSLQRDLGAEGRKCCYLNTSQTILRTNLLLLWSRVEKLLGMFPGF